jgi:hypothetical protein
MPRVTLFIADQRVAEMESSPEAFDAAVVAEVRAALAGSPANGGVAPELSEQCRLCGAAKGHPHAVCPNCGKIDREPEGMGC